MPDLVRNQEDLFSIFTAYLKSFFVSSKRTPEQEMEDFERMRALGVFQGAPPDGEEYLDFSE